MNNTEIQDNEELQLTISTRRVKLPARGTVTPSLLEQHAMATLPDEPTDKHHALAMDVQALVEQNREEATAHLDATAQRQRCIEQVVMYIGVALIVVFLVGVFVGSGMYAGVLHALQVLGVVR